MAAQRFTLPTLPFAREVYNGCAIGTSIIVDAEPYDDRLKISTIQLTTINDIALSVQLPVGRGKVTASARISGSFTSEIEQSIELAPKRRFKWHIRVNTHVFEIYHNDRHVMDFVHRVSPLEVKSVSIEGPLIVHEVVFAPPQGASLDPLPNYDEAMKTGIPVEELAALRLNSKGGPQQSVVAPAGTLAYSRGIETLSMPSTTITTAPPSVPPTGPPTAAYERDPYEKERLPTPPPQTVLPPPPGPNVRPPPAGGVPLVGYVTPQPNPSTTAQTLPTQRAPPYPTNVAPITPPAPEKTPPYPDARTMFPYPQAPTNNGPSQLPYPSSSYPAPANQPSANYPTPPPANISVVQQEPVGAAPSGPSNYPSYPSAPAPSAPSSSGAPYNPNGAPYNPSGAPYNPSGAPYNPNYGNPSQQYPSGPYNSYTPTPSGYSPYGPTPGAAPAAYPYGGAPMGSGYPQYPQAYPYQQPYGYGYSSYETPYYGYDHCHRVRHCSSGSGC